MIFKISLYLLAVISFLFFYWKRLREDYISTHVFTSGFYILLGVVFGSLFRQINAEFSFWFSFIGGFLGFWLGVYRYKFRIFEALDAAIFASLVGFLLVQVEYLVRLKTLFSSVWVIIPFCLIALFLILDKHYRQFTWYKSGRVGFSGMSVSGTFFIVRSLLALIDSDVLSLSRQDAILSGIIAFACFLSVFNLARMT